MLVTADHHRCTIPLQWYSMDASFGFSNIGLCYDCTINSNIIEVRSAIFWETEKRDRTASWCSKVVLQRCPHLQISFSRCLFVTLSWFNSFFLWDRKGSFPLTLNHITIKISVKLKVQRVVLGKRFWTEQKDLHSLMFICINTFNKQTLSFHDWISWINKLTLKDKTVSYCLTLLISGRPCHLSSINQCSWDILFIQVCY